MHPLDSTLAMLFLLLMSFLVTWLLPGYIISKIIWKSDEIDLLKRIAFSFGLSISLLPILGTIIRFFTGNYYFDYYITLILFTGIIVGFRKTKSLPALFPGNIHQLPKNINSAIIKLKTINLNLVKGFKINSDKRKYLVLCLSGLILINIAQVLYYLYQYKVYSYYLSTSAITYTQALDLIIRYESFVNILTGIVIVILLWLGFKKCDNVVFETVDDSKPDISEKKTILWLLIIAAFVASLSVIPMLFVNGLGDRSDASFHIAVIQNLLNNGYPWKSPFYPDDSNLYPYFFHYMVSILYSATSWIGEYTVVDIYEYSHILFIIPVIFSLAVLGKEMTQKNSGAIFFASFGFFLFPDIATMLLMTNTFTFFAILGPLIFIAFFAPSSLDFKHSLVYGIFMSGLLNAHTPYGLGLFISMLLLTIVYLFTRNAFARYQVVCVTTATLLWLPIFLNNYFNIESISTDSFLPGWVIYVHTRYLFSAPLDFKTLIPIGAASVFSYLGFMYSFKKNRSVFIGLCTLIAVALAFRVYPWILYQYYGNMFDIVTSAFTIINPTKIIITSFQSTFGIFSVYSLYILYSNSKGKTDNYLTLSVSILAISTILMSIFTSAYIGTYLRSDANPGTGGLYDWIANNTQDDDIIFPGNEEITTFTGRYVVNRWYYAPNIPDEFEDFHIFFGEDDPEDALKVLDKYQADYIVIGPYDYNFGRKTGLYVTIQTLFTSDLSDNILFNTTLETYTKDEKIDVSSKSTVIDMSKFVEPYFTKVYDSDEGIIYKVNY